MCGISGLYEYNKDSTDSLFLENQLHMMNKFLHHRGPDDEGVWMHEKLPVGLAQTRLSILDLTEAGHQPMKEGLTGNVLAFNGEIFNYRDINRDYLSDESFISGTDTETVLKLYRSRGLDMFDRMNGMFAFGLWDSEKEELILARDRSGKKPLYYTEIGGRFAFASELKAILALPWIKRELDEEALYDFLTYNVVISPATMFKGIYKFKPGYSMTVSSKGIESYRPYYILEKKQFDDQRENYFENLIYEKLEESVKYRMISDVPVGAFLSGGVDSTAIVGLMRQNTNEEIKTFTIGFENQPDYNELVYAEKASRLFNTNHFEKIVKPGDLIELLPGIVDIYDEPQADTTSIPIYFISQLANQQGIKVVLNGDGPDELFTGYSRDLQYLKYWSYFYFASKFPDFIKKGFEWVAGSLSRDTPVHEMAKRLSKNQDFHWPGARGIKEGLKGKVLHPIFNKRMGDYSSYWYIEELRRQYINFSGDEKISDPINWMSFSGYRHADIEQFLFRSDRLGMAHSVESRSPFLNHEMIEIALSIPSKYKVHNSTGKYILKKSLEKLVPKEFLYRKKMGFCLPINEWAGKTITSFVEENIAELSSNLEIFSREQVLNMVKLLKRGDLAYTNSVWTIYFLLHWFKKWL